MNRSFDKLGRIVIPVEMRKQLGINNNDPVNIKCTGDKIIITNPEKIDYKAIIEEAIEDLKFNQCKAYEAQNDVEYDKFQGAIDILNKGLKK